MMSCLELSISDTFVPSPPSALRGIDYIALLLPTLITVLGTFFVPPRVCYQHQRHLSMKKTRLMVSVNEAIARGLSLALGLADKDDQDLSRLCEGGDTISLLRLFHYFPYENGVGE